MLKATHLMAIANVMLLAATSLLVLFLIQEAGSQIIAIAIGLQLAALGFYTGLLLYVQDKNL